MHPLSCAVLQYTPQALVERLCLPYKALAVVLCRVHFQRQSIPFPSCSAAELDRSLLDLPPSRLRTPQFPPMYFCRVGQGLFHLEPSSLCTTPQTPSGADVVKNSLAAFSITLPPHNPTSFAYLHCTKCARMDGHAARRVGGGCSWAGQSSDCPAVPGGIQGGRPRHEDALQGNALHVLSTPVSSTVVDGG